MQHSRDSDTWSLHPTMVHWPTRGVLLRWAKRPKGMQFHTICVQARLWPDAASVEGYKGVVRTHHIHFHKLPAPQEFPDMKCFLFVVDPKQDVGREARSMTAVDNELAALGKLQAAQEQSPLHAGKSYQFQVIAYDDEGSVVETSAWSRPTTIDVRRKFVELPLLLWQGWCRIVPSSTFKYFVKKHCVTLPKDPAMRIRLKQLRLTLVSPGAECLAGAPPAPVGAETPLEQVQVLFSTSGGKLKATDQVLLPSRDERKERRLQKPMSEVFPGSVRADAGQQCVVLDAFQKAIEIDVGSDLSEQLTIEVSVTSEDGKETTAAKWKSDWSHLLDVFSHRRSAKQELSDEIVLLEGLTPVAFLSARFEISNPCLPSTARPNASPAANEDFPDIFEKIRPGCAVYWSESVKLEWDVPTENQDTDVEVVLVGYELDISKLARKKIVPRSSSFSTTLCSLKLRAGQQTVVMCPPQLLQDGMLCCHMQAFVNQEGTRKLVLCSHQFAVVRPILIQDLELCYAGFCARRGIRMEQVDVDRFGDFGIRTTERLLHVARGFRAPLPVPHELKVVQHEEELRAMAPDSPNLILIENGPSVILSSEDDPMQLRYCSLSQEIHGVHAKQPSKFGRQLSVAKTQEALTTPLLSAGEDDEQAQASIAPVTPTTPVSPNSHKPRTVDGHRQSVEIPTNVFWRPTVESHGSDFGHMATSCSPMQPAKTDAGQVECFLLVLGLGCLPCPSAVRLAREAGATLKAEIDREELWRACFLQRYPDRPAVAGLVESGLSSLAPSLWRLAGRLPPREGLRLDIGDPETDTGAHDWQAGLLVVGGPRSGKTWLVHRFCTGGVPDRLDKVPSLGTDMRVVRVRMRSKQLHTRGRLRIWEPSGFSRKQALGGYLKAAQVVVVAVDATELQAPHEAKQLLSKASESMRPGTILALCGLQVDRLSPPQYRAASHLLGQSAKMAHAEFGMCSALTGEGVEDFFCAVLAACQESSIDLPAAEPVLNRVAGTLTSTELLRALLHRDERSADWVSDPLLKYALLPNFVAETQDPLEICLRGVLLTLMFWVQFAALLVPVMCLHALVVWHDAIRAVTRSDLFSQDTEHFFLLDFVMEPTPFRFANLDYATKLILGSSLLYFMLIGATVAYSMVIGLPKPLPADGFFEGADRIIMCVTSVLVAGTTLVVTNALVWIVLGSLIRPADLIPYAIMLAAVVTMGHSMLSKFRGMKKYCESKMTTLLDAALVAIFKVMAGDRQILNDVEEKKEEFEHLKDKVSHLVPKGEQHMREAMTQMVKDGRNQPGTKEFLKALEKGRKQPVKAQDLKAAEKQRKVKKLAKGLAVHTATVELMLDCFDNFVILKRLSEDSAAHANSSASTLSTLISTARKDCLFGHFLRPDKGKDNKDEDKAPEPKEAKIHPDPESEPRVLSLLYHLQNEEMERMDAVVAQCLSKCLNWSFISRQVDVFCSQTLPSGVVLNAVEREVSVVVQGSAAAQVILGAFQVGYELFETRYRTNPLEIFSDCGLLTADVVKRPQVQFILNSEIDAQLKGGSELSPKALIAAVRSICLQNEKVALTTGSQPKAYFWYKALVAVLKDLGWSKEELEPSKGWLQQRWEELTDGCGLFEYSSTEEVVSLVLRISNGGLWKAAAKSMLLKAGVGGYACCQGIPKEAAEMARELEGCNVLDLSLVNEKCDWPPDVTKLWEECATVASPDGPSFLHASKVLQFMEALVYEPAEDKTEEAKQKLVPLSPFANSMEDLAWQKETGKAPNLWHVKPSGRRKLRGLWLELVLQIFDSMDCIPSDLDLFFECQAATEKNGAVSFVLHLHKFKAWLKRDYFSKLTDCTFNQFKVIVQDMLKCQIPEEALKEEVFDICPTIPDDDQGELRAISDLGAALFAYTDHGLWSEAMRLVAKRLLAAGPVRDYALNHLDDEFAAHDVAKRGVLSISEAMDMLQSVAVPGLTCSDLARLLEKELGIEVPRAELHKYFTTMDVNGDGLLQDEEFVQVIRFLMLDYYPHHILKHLHLTLGQITLFVFGALLAIGVVFLLVTLVIDFFKAGEDVAATLHGGFSAIFGVVGKRLSDEGIGFEDTMKNLELKLESMMVTALVMVLGLSKEMQDVFRSVLTSAEELAASRS
ncbi:RAB34 [Symbiodinium natans]|uniref:RAB34 protein n=1 Tax=Symbiodinium natans TaxID=878477 RepID=A0A812UJN9_9DINO|nr:RAB34 [Symbiodinium natans]